MEETEKVTSRNISEVCRKFGFPYELRDGKHFAAIGNVKVEIKFRPDGTLPPGRHAFMMAAREESEEFRAAYPTVSRKTSASGNQSDGNGDDRPPLGKRLLRKYSILELAKAKDLIVEIISEKKEAEEKSRRIEEHIQELEDLKELVKKIQEKGFGSHKPIIDRVAQINEELVDLRRS